MKYTKKEIDKIWAVEAEKRVKAYDEGKIKAIPVKDVFAKYKNNEVNLS